MASVIRVLTEHSVGGEFVASHPTWSPQSQLHTVRLLTAATRMLLRIPPMHIAHVHLSERGSFLREGALLALARHRGLVTVATIHGASFSAFAHQHPRLISAVLTRADLVTCLDNHVLEVVRHSAPAVQSELVANPVVIESDVPPADETDELVVFAGEICLRKGADVLARAWPSVAQRRPTARCLMVGPLADFKPAPTDRLDVGSPVGPAEMSRMLRAARVIALPSRAEAMPMILAEAMSMGRPFVGTPVGAIPDLAAAGGMLVPVDDAEALADRLTDLLSNPDRAKRLGERGRRFCLETRSIGVIDARLRDLYKAAVASRSRRIAARRFRPASPLRRNE